MDVCACQSTTSSSSSFCVSSILPLDWMMANIIPLSIKAIDRGYFYTSPYYIIINSFILTHSHSVDLPSSIYGRPESSPLICKFHRPVSCPEMGQRRLRKSEISRCDIIHILVKIIIIVIITVGQVVVCELSFRVLQRLLCLILIKK